MELVTGKRIVAIGEGMVELAGGIGDAGRIRYGGDIVNIVVAMARLGLRPAVLTAVGTDPWSDALVDHWADEGVDTSLVAYHPHRAAGIYGITVDAAGERSFTYWRDGSAARDLFALTDSAALLERAATADMLILSGITLSLYDEFDRDRLAEVAAAVRASGGIVAFDGNYRPRGWSDATTARKAFARFARHVTLALPTTDDETLLHGSAQAPLVIARRWHDWSADEVVVKLGAGGALISSPSEAVHVPTKPVSPVDTSGAGDAFDAGYLASRILGRRPTDAARLGHSIAAATIAHPGAIPPASAIAGFALA